MSNIALCTVCLASNAKMHHLANTRYQETFEKLSTRLCTADQRPETICYICFALLQRCQQFVDMSQNAEAILSELSVNRILITEDTVSIIDRSFAHNLVCTPLNNISINTSDQFHVKEEFKQELSENELIDCADLYSVEICNLTEILKGDNTPKFEDIVSTTSEEPIISYTFSDIDTMPPSVEITDPLSGKSLEHLQLQKKSNKIKSKNHLWKRNLVKFLKNRCQAYTSLAKSEKVVEAKKVGPTCGEKCKLKCYEAFTLPQRRDIFDDYWKTGDLLTQRRYIREHMTTITPKYRYVVIGSKRVQNNAFYLPKNGQKVRVCKYFFVNTLAISGRAISTVLKKTSGSEHGYLQLEDKRGKHTSHRRLDINLTNAVRDHINSIPRIKRKSSDRELIKGSTVTALHREYVADQSSKGLQPASYNIYYRIFMNEFNLTFYPPKSKTKISEQNPVELNQEHTAANKTKSQLNHTHFEMNQSQHDKNQEHFSEINKTQSWINQIEDESLLLEIERHTQIVEEHDSDCDREGGSSMQSSDIEKDPNYYISRKTEADYFDSDEDMPLSSAKDISFKPETSYNFTESLSNETRKFEDATYIQSDTVPTSAACITEPSTTEHAKRVEIKTKPQKTKARPHLWKQNFTKILKNRGQSYTSLASQKVVEAKKVGPACGEKCKLKCYAAFTLTQRRDIFDDYWKTGDLLTQRRYIREHMTTITPKYRYVVIGSKRVQNNAFYLPKNGQKVRVCKYFFVNTLAISGRAISTVLKKTSGSEHGYLQLEDKRGKHTSHRRLDINLTNAVRDHINSIPRIKRKSSDRELIKGSTVTALHREYVADQSSKGLQPASYNIYYRIFMNEFNLKFYPPKSKTKISEQNSVELNQEHTAANKTKTQLNHTHFGINQSQHDKNQEYFSEINKTQSWINQIEDESLLLETEIHTQIVEEHDSDNDREGGSSMQSSDIEKDPKYYIFRKTEAEYFDSDEDMPLSSAKDILFKPETSYNLTESLSNETRTFEDPAHVKSDTLPTSAACITEPSTTEHAKRVEIKTKPQKTKARPHLWKQNFTKILKNRGQSYTSLASQKVVEAKKVGPACGEKCKLKCYAAFTLTQRRDIFDDYWKTGDLLTQRRYIREHMTTITPKYRYVVIGSKRVQNNAFYLPKNGQKVRVCKYFFVNTLAISGRAISTVLKKTSGSEHGYLQLEDKRGKHTSHRRLDINLTNAVRDHINSISRIKSKSSDREYIKGSTVTALHREYVADQSSKGLQSASYNIYYRIFMNEFNLTFYPPKSKTKISEQNPVELNQEHTAANKTKSQLNHTHFEMNQSQHDKNQEHFSEINKTQSWINQIEDESLLLEIERHTQIVEEHDSDCDREGGSSMQSSDIEKDPNYYISRKTEADYFDSDEDMPLSSAKDISFKPETSYNFTESLSNETRKFEDATYIQSDTVPTSACITDPSTTESAKRVEIKTKPQKTKARPHLWKQNLTKILKNRGQSYTSLASQKVVEAKKVGPACGEKCKLKCYEAFTLTQRRDIFDDYWKTGDLLTQRRYIREHMTTITPKYRYVVIGSKRVQNNAFYLPKNGQKVRVCKYFFGNTLAISGRAISTVLKKTSGSEHGYLQLEDKRGKHTSHRRLDINLTNAVRDHINSIPRIKRKSSDREFIKGSTVTALHREYVADQSSKGLQHVSYIIYYRIFMKEFNLTLYTPKRTMSGKRKCK